jgi:hypothetical protein
MKSIFYSYFTFVCIGIASGQSKNKILFQARIENRNWDFIYIKDINYKTKRIIKINNSGYFTDQLELDNGIYFMFDGAEYFKIYLSNGYDLKITMDADDFRNTLLFSGIGADINNFLVQEAAQEVDYNYGLLSMGKKEETDELINSKEKAALERLNIQNFEPNFVKLESDAIKIHTEELKKYYGELREIN